MNEVSQNDGPLVGLFATCIVDLMRPGVGFAAAELLQQAGCRVEVPASQTCCGQPTYNSGDIVDTKSIAQKTIVAFEVFDYIVVPSGSCASMLKEHYPKLFVDASDWSARAEAFANKVFELTQFLSDVIDVGDLSATCETTATYHDSCSGLRELGIKSQPRKLLAQINGLLINEGEKAERCCGFGGLFCVKYGDISTGMVDEKIDDLEASGAKLVLGGDLGCLMNIAGRLKRRGSVIEVRHLAEVLAGMIDRPAIAEPVKGND